MTRLAKCLDTPEKREFRKRAARLWGMQKQISHEIADKIRASQKLDSIGLRGHEFGSTQTHPSSKYLVFYTTGTQEPTEHQLAANNSISHAFL